MEFIGIFVWLFCILFFREFFEECLVCVRWLYVLEVEKILEYFDDNWKCLKKVWLSLVIINLVGLILEFIGVFGSWCV